MNRQQKYRSRLQSRDTFEIDARNIQVLTSTADFRRVLLEHIEKATSRILITSLYLEDDAAGNELLNRLYERRAERPSLDIRVFVDYHRARRGLIGADRNERTNADLYREKAAAHDAEVPVFGVPVKQRELFGVMHLKGIVVDDVLLYSGASINNVYLHFGDRYRYDRYICIQDAALCDSFADYLAAALGRHFAVTSLNRSSSNHRQRRQVRDIRALKRSLRRHRYRVPPGRSSPETVGVTPLVGLGRRGNELNRCIRDLIRGSEEKLQLFTPYFNLPDILKRDLRGALLRGVQVDIVVGDKTANDFYIEPDAPFRRIGVIPFLYEIYLRRFARYNERFIDQRRLNIHIWRHDRNTFHLKGICSDGRYHLLTGNNLNSRAWGLDLENGLLLDDRGHLLRDAFEREWETIIHHARRLNSYVDVDDRKSYPPRVQRTLNRVRRTRTDALLRRWM